MYTQCAHCRTAFEIGAEDLRRAHGRVRCGQCGAVFDALETLTPEPPPAADPEEHRVWEPEPADLRQTDGHVPELQTQETAADTTAGISRREEPGTATDAEPPGEPQRFDDDTPLELVLAALSDDPPAARARQTSDPGGAAGRAAEVPGAVAPEEADLDDEDEWRALLAELDLDDSVLSGAAESLRSSAEEEAAEEVAEEPEVETEDGYEYVYVYEYEDADEDEDEDASRYGDADLDGEEDGEDYWLAEHEADDEEAIGSGHEDATDDEEWIGTWEEEPTGREGPPPPDGGDSVGAGHGPDLSAAIEPIPQPMPGPLPWPEPEPEAEVAPEPEPEMETVREQEADREPEREAEPDGVAVAAIPVATSDASALQDRPPPVEPAAEPPEPRQAAPVEPEGAGEELFEEELPRHRSGARTAMWSALAGLLILLLGGQVIHGQRAVLATHPRIGPTVLGIYDALGIPIQPYWDIDALCVESSSGDAAAGALQITTVIRNRGDRPQPYPLLHVAVTDRWQGGIGRLTLPAEEYLPEGRSGAAMMVPGARVRASASLADPGSEAAGYELHVCYRNPDGGLRCSGACG